MNPIYKTGWGQYVDLYPLGEIYAPLDAAAKMVSDSISDSIRSAVSKVGDVNAELSESEKFAICFYAGVPIRHDFKDGKMTMTADVDCGVCNTGGRYRVFTKPKEEPAMAWESYRNQ